MKIVIVGNYGANNLGDELILEGLLKTIRKIKPAADIVVLSADPKKTKEKFEVRSIKKFPAGLRSIFQYIFIGALWKTIKEVRNCDFVIVGGGGLFDDTRFKAIWIWTVQTAIAYLLRRKVIMYGQSIKPLKSKLAQKIIKKLFQKAIFIAVRDEDSKEILKTLLKGRQIYTMPDLIFNLEPKFEQAKENKILICMRDHTGKPKDFDKNVTIFLNHLLHEDENLKIEFLPFQKGSDERYHLSLIEKITNKDRTLKHEYTDERHKVESLFTESKLIFGVRLHSILMAINTGTPFIAINYNPKVRNILRTLNLEQFVLNPKDVTPQALLSLYERMMGEESKIRTKLREIKHSQAQKHLLIEEKLKSFLG